MAVEFQMPKLGLTMEEGTIVEWLVDDGQQVAAGQHGDVGDLGKVVVVDDQFGVTVDCADTANVGQNVAAVVTLSSNECIPTSARIISSIIGTESRRIARPRGSRV